MSIKRIYIILFVLGVIRSPVPNNMTESTIAAYWELAEQLKNGLPPLQMYHFAHPQEYNLLSKWFNTSPINFESSKVGPFLIQYNPNSVTIMFGLEFPSVTGIKIQSDEPWSEAELARLLQDGCALSAQIQCGLKEKSDDVEAEFRRKYHITSMQNFHENFSPGHVSGFNQSAFLHDFFRSTPCLSPMEYNKHLFLGSVALGVPLDIIKDPETCYLVLGKSLFIELKMEDQLLQNFLDPKFNAEKLKGSSQDFTMYSLPVFLISCPPPCPDISYCEVLKVNLDGTIEPKHLPQPLMPTPDAIKLYWTRKYGTTLPDHKYVELTGALRYEPAHHDALESLMQALGRLNAQPLKKIILTSQSPERHDPQSPIAHLFRSFGPMFPGSVSDLFNCVDLGVVKCIMLREDLLMYAAHNGKISLLHLMYPEIPMNFNGPDSELRGFFSTILRSLIDVKKRNPGLYNLTNPSELLCDLSEKGFKFKNALLTRIAANDLRPLNEDFALQNNESPIKAMASVLFPPEPYSSLQTCYDLAMGNMFYGAEPIRFVKRDDGTYFLRLSEHVILQIRSCADGTNLAEFETIGLSDGPFFDAQRFFENVSEQKYNIQIIFPRGERQAVFRYCNEFRLTGDIADPETWEMLFDVEITDQPPGIPGRKVGRSDQAIVSAWKDVFS